MSKQCVCLTLKLTQCTRKATTGDTCSQHANKCNRTEEDVIRAMTNKSRPSYKIMIGMAILAQQSNIGTSLVYIKQYLASNYKIDPNKPKLINKTIRSMLESGELHRHKIKTEHYLLDKKYKIKVFDFRSERESKVRINNKLSI